MEPKNTVVIKYYLINYKKNMMYITNVKADIADYEKMMSLNAAPKVPSLSLSPGGGGVTDSQQEREYFSKEDIREKVGALQADLGKLTPIMKRLNRSLEALTDTDREIIRCKYIEGFSWYITANEAHCSEGYCRKRCEKILGILDGMIFGPGEIPIPTKLLY
jgi:hypothetical protein